MKHVSIIKTFIILFSFLFAGCSVDLPEGYTVNRNFLRIGQNGVLHFSDQETSQSITLESKGTWSCIGHPEWLEVTPKSGTGTSQVSVKIVEYPSDNIGKIDTVYIKLGDLISKIIVNLAPYKFDVTPKTEFVFGAQEDNKKELFINCFTKWNVKKEFDWCHVSELSGSGEKTLSIYCDNNNTNQIRRDTLQIRTNLDTIYVPIFQSSSAFYIVPSTPKLEYGIAGGVQSFTVMSNTEWLPRLLHGGMGTLKQNGNELTLTVNENTSADVRFDTILIASTNPDINVHGMVYVRQIGRTPILEIAPDSLDSRPLLFGRNGGEGAFSIKSNLRWNLICKCEDGGNWCRITSDLSGNDNAVVNIVVDNNPLGSAPRTAVITINTSSVTKEIKVNQAAGEKPILEIIPSALEETPLSFNNAGHTQTFSIQSNVEWSVICSDASWCHIETPQGTGAGQKEVKVTVDVNPAESPERRCSLLVKSSWFDDKKIAIYQEKGAEGFIIPFPAVVSAPPQGGTVLLEVQSNLSSWVVSSSSDWCKVNTISGSLNGTVELTIGLNSDSEARDATITIKSAIKDVTVTVYQEPKAVPGGGDNPDPSYSRKR